MEELIVSNDELKKMFEDKRMIDDNKGWLLDGIEIEIFAIHQQESKYISDITHAESYKLIKKEKRK